MKKISIILCHYRTWEWTAICLHHFKKFPLPEGYEREIIVVNNSPGHPSIKVLTETPLGDGVKVYPGREDFPSHGMGYDIAYGQSSGDWIFTTETDAFPIKEGWFENWEKHMHASVLIGPSVPQSSGTYIHPAGCLYQRELIEDAIRWQKKHKDWIFVPGAAQRMGLSDKGFHVVCHKENLMFYSMDDVKQSDLWKDVGPFQEMRTFDPDDSFDTYHLRQCATFLEPREGRNSYLRIGLESGQWLYWFALNKGFPTYTLNSSLSWMTGHENKQAAYSEICGCFRHIWAGSMSEVGALSEEVKGYKFAVRDAYFATLPEGLQKSISQLKNAN